MTNYFPLRASHNDEKIECSYCNDDTFVYKVQEKGKMYFVRLP
jgi:hypothetical protein